MNHKDKNQRPTTTSPHFANCPAEMQSLKQWVMWKYVWKDDEQAGGNWTKVPFQPNGEPASTTTPDTWSDYPTVRYAYNNRKGFWDGIGFVFTREAGIVGIDVDDAVSWVIPDDGGEACGVFDKWLKAVLRKINDTYTEFSPSRSGVHLFVKANPKQAIKYTGGGLEIYAESRYFTFTGDLLADCTTEIGDATQAVDEIIESLLNTREKKREEKAQNQVPTEPVSLPTATHLSIDELLRVAFAATNGAEIKSLFDGNYGQYPSRSEADMALARYLSFYSGGHPLVLAQMMERSALARSKWNQRATAGGATKLSLVIDKVLSTEHNYFEPAKSFFNPNATKGNTDAAAGDRLARTYRLSELGPSALAYRRDPNTRGMECGGSFDELDEIYRPRRKLVTVTVGDSGAGKTTFWLNYLRQFVMRNNLRAGISSFESDPNEIAHALVQAHLQRPTFPDETGCCTDAEFTQALAEMSDYITIYVPRWEERNITALSGYWDDSIKNGGLDCVYLDPFTNLQPPERLFGKYNEFAEQELARFFDYVQTRALFGWLVCHPTKNYNRKDGLRLWNICGSKAFETLADYGVVLTRPNDKLIVDMQKVRVWRTGDANAQRAFHYNLYKGVYTPTVCNIEPGFSGGRNYSRNRR